MDTIGFFCYFYELGGAFGAIIFFKMIQIIMSFVAWVLIIIHVSFTGLSRKSARNQVMMSQPKVTRSISIKDVIAVLEREPQMSKTTLIYRLHEKTRADAVAE